MTAILVDNDKQQRMMGLQDQDVAEIYEQSVEIMALNESVSRAMALTRVSSGRKLLSMRSVSG